MSILEGQSLLDQDDSYGNYRPTFLVKNHKVTGRTPQIVQLQRQASVDTGKALLGPIQPDLSNEKVTQRRMFLDNANNKLVNHIAHQSEVKMQYASDGSPLPRRPDQEHFFRKALDHYTHDSIPEGVINDVAHYKQKVTMEGNRDR